MQVQIEIERPFSLFVTIVMCVSMFAWLTHTPAQTEESLTMAETLPANLVAAGGNEEVTAEVVHETEEEIAEQRILRAVLENKEEILRYQLNMLDAERQANFEDMTAEEQAEFTEASEKLIALLRDKHEAEMQIAASLQQLWDAQVRVSSIVAYAGDLPTLAWPVEPYYGISAHFHDKEYEKVFGIPHDAIDIPAKQGTDIMAIADGTVEKVVDNGYGYSYLIIRHEGVASLIGHISGFYVKEGERVRQGQVVAASGGRPGTKGAGLLSTGPHVHLEIIQDGQRVDPIALLPDRATIVKDEHDHAHKEL